MFICAILLIIWLQCRNDSCWGALGKKSGREPTRAVGGAISLLSSGVIKRPLTQTPTRSGWEREIERIVLAVSVCVMCVTTTTAGTVSPPPLACRQLTPLSLFSRTLAASHPPTSHLRQAMPVAPFPFSVDAICRRI